MGAALDFLRKKVAHGKALSDFFGSLLYHTKDYQGTTTLDAALVDLLRLYHTKDYQGTTTLGSEFLMRKPLYHTKDYQGTTTSGTFDFTRILLYHTKDYQGTTTNAFVFTFADALYHTKDYQGTTTSPATSWRACPWAASRADKPVSDSKTTQLTWQGNVPADRKSEV